MHTFHEFIAQRREALGLSQRDLATLVGVTHAVISRIESGLATDFKFTTFLGLSTALQIHPMVLIRLYEGETSTHPIEQADDDEVLVNAFRDFLAQRRAQE
jgi:transcriptional regulator with XRE-family HTH domain